MEVGYWPCWFCCSMHYNRPTDALDPKSTVFADLLLVSIALL